MDRSKNEPGTLGADKLSTGANVSRTMDSLNATDTPVSGGAAFSKHNFDKIDPSTGDIILTPSAKPKKGGLFGGLFGGSSRNRATKTAQPAQPESTSIIENRSASVNIPAEFQNPTETKKPVNKKFIVIALIILLVIAGIGVGVWAVMSNTGKGSNNKTNANSVVGDTEASKKAFTSLADYIIFDDSQNANLAEVLGDITDPEYANNVFYANRMLYKDNSADKTAYFTDLSNLYRTFASVYNGENDRFKVINDYYYGLYSVGYIELATLLQYYLANGLEATKEYINNNISSDYENFIVASYADYLSSYLLAALEVYDSANSFGCLSETGFTCSTVNEEKVSSFKNAENDYYNYRATNISSMNAETIEVLQEIFAELYDISDEDIEETSL